MSFIKSLLQKKTYLNPVNKVFFSIIYSIVILFIISLLIIFKYDQTEPSEWLIFQVCSIVIFLTTVICIHPDTKIKQIYLYFGFIALATLSLIQIYVVQHVNHLISYRYIILTTLGAIPAYYSFQQNHNIKNAIRIFFINFFLIFNISSYFFEYIDLFPIKTFFVIITLVVILNTFMIGELFNMKNKIFTFFSLCAMFLFLLFFSPQHFDIHHYSFYVGPAYEISQGKSILSDAPSQYGYLSIHFIKTILAPIGINMNNFHLLNLALFGLYFIGFLIIFVKITKNLSLSIILTMIVISFQTYFSKWGGILYPSTGPLRFGFGLLIVLIILYFPRKYKILSASLISSIAIFWSLETAFFIVPAFIFTIAIDCYIHSTNFKQTFLLFLKKTALFIFISLSLFALIFIKEYEYHKIFPTIFNYIQFANIYKDGFGAEEIPLFGNYYVVILTLIIGVTLAIYSVFQKDKDKITLALIFLSIHNVAILSYFISRSHPNNIVNLSPFVFLEIVIIVYFFIHKIKVFSQYYYIPFILFTIVFITISITNLNDPTLTTRVKYNPKILFKYQDLKNMYSLTQNNVIILSKFHDTEIVLENKINTPLPLNPGVMTTVLPDYHRRYLIPNFNKIINNTILVYTQDRWELFNFFKKNFTLKEIDPKTDKGIFKLYTILNK